MVRSSLARFSYKLCAGMGAYGSGVAPPYAVEVTVAQHEYDLAARKEQANHTNFVVAVNYDELEGKVAALKQRNEELDGKVAGKTETYARTAQALIEARKEND